MTDSLILAVLIGLSGYRLARLVSTDSILDMPRHRLFLRFPPKDPYYQRTQKVGGTWQVSEKITRDPTWLGKLLSCAWCQVPYYNAAIVAIVCRYASVPLPGLVWAASLTIGGATATLLGG